MTYNDVLLKHYQDLKSKVDVIESDMNIFLKENEDEDDAIKLCNNFERKFNSVVLDFQDEYSKTCPASIVNTDFRDYAMYNSLKLSNDLRSSYKRRVNDIESAFPAMDDFQEIHI